MRKRALVCKNCGEDRVDGVPCVTIDPGDRERRHCSACEFYYRVPFRFRYKAEGPEAKAWREIAEHVEYGGGVFWAQGMAPQPFRCGLTEAVGFVRGGQLGYDMQLRLDAMFGTWLPDVVPILWPQRGNADKHGRTLAAWFLYWQAREEGK